MTTDTLKMLTEFRTDINFRIEEQRSLSEKSQYLQVLKQRQHLAVILEKAKEIDANIQTNNIQVSQNARPQIKVSA